MRQFPFRRRLRVVRTRTALVAGAVVVTLATSCAGEPTVPAESVGFATEPATAATGTTEPSAQLSMTLPGTIAAAFQELQSGWRGELGMAVMAVGGDHPATFGDWSTGPAWSTMKVPLVIAAIRANAANNGYAATAAITQSDNTAADVLWASLGSDEQAAAAVVAVLREAGDSETTVPALRTRAEHSSFGQTEWSLIEQARFASRLPCLPQSATVTELMGQIVANHRWGLGAYSGTEFKGGWGPDTAGRYLVRQFGVIDAPTGKVAVAFAARPESGAFGDGMNAVNEMAALVSDHIDELAAGRCPR